MALHKFFTKHHIILHKGKNWHILLTLAWNQILLLKLRIYKRLHNIHRPIVHYYAVCWNEERMLPFVFRHYDQFVDHYTFYDNYSDDSSEEIIHSHKNTSIVKFKTEGFDDVAHISIKNNCWKCSRGKADYVIVCDIDEFAFSSNLRKYLQHIHTNHVSMPNPIGFNMYSKTFPSINNALNITDQVKTGVQDNGYSKCILFDPHRVVEINYDAGAHICHPYGQIVRGGEYKVLHYKNLDLELVLERTVINAHRLSPTNLKMNLGYAYLYPEERIRKEFEDNIEISTIVTE